METRSTRPRVRYMQSKRRDSYHHRTGYGTAEMLFFSTCQCVAIPVLGERRWPTDIHREKPRESSESNRNNFASPANGNGNGNGNVVEGRSNRGSNPLPPPFLPSPQTPSHTSHATCTFCSLLTSVSPLFIGPWKKKRLNATSKTIKWKCNMSDTSLRTFAGRTRGFQFPACYRHNTLRSHKYSYTTRNAGIIVFPRSDHDLVMTVNNKRHGGE